MTGKPPPRKFAGSSAAMASGGAEAMPAVERALSGDFVSPAEVLADAHLSVEQKREVFDVWLRDLAAQPHKPEMDALRESITAARASLESDESRDTQGSRAERSRARRGER